jgi:hypothetical protein
VPTCVVLNPPEDEGTDAYLKQDKVDDGKGGDSELRVKTEQEKLQRTLVRFDLSSVPSGATVASVTLSLWVKDLNGPAVTIAAHQVLEPWHEPEVTWADRNRELNLPWSTPGGTYAAAVADALTIADEDLWASWDLTSLGADWLAGYNYGVILEAPVSDPKSEVKFKSNNDGDDEHRPFMEVCYWQ